MISIAADPGTGSSITVKLTRCPRNRPRIVTAGVGLHSLHTLAALMLSTAIARSTLSA